MGTAGEAGTPDASCTTVDDYTAERPFTPCTGTCPTLKQLIMDRRASDCASASRAERLEVILGCDLNALTWGSVEAGGSYYFDGDTGALVGTTEYKSVPWGPCERRQYVAGKQEQCGDAPSCHVCDGTWSGGGGEGGVPGFSGPNCTDALLESGRVP